MLIPYIKFHDPIFNRSWPYAKRNGQTGGRTDPNQYAPWRSWGHKNCAYNEDDQLPSVWSVFVNCIKKTYMYLHSDQKLWSDCIDVSLWKPCLSFERPPKRGSFQIIIKCNTWTTHIIKALYAEPYDSNVFGSCIFSFLQSNWATEN